MTKNSQNNPQNRLPLNMNTNIGRFDDLENYCPILVFRAENYTWTSGRSRVKVDPRWNHVSGRSINKTLFDNKDWTLSLYCNLNINVCVICGLKTWIIFFLYSKSPILLTISPIGSHQTSGLWRKNTNKSLPWNCWVRGERKTDGNCWVRGERKTDLCSRLYVEHDWEMTPWAYRTAELVLRECWRVESGVGGESVRSFQLHGLPWRPSTSWMRLWTLSYPSPPLLPGRWLAQPSPTTLSPLDPNSYSL